MRERKRKGERKEGQREKGRRREERELEKEKVWGNERYSKEVERGVRRW